MIVGDGLRIKPSFGGKDMDGDKLFINKMGVDIRLMTEIGISMTELELKRL